MRLIVMRHGISHDLGEDGSTSDAKRTLTPKGLLEVQQIAETLKLLEPNIQSVLSSPYQRAIQTATQIARRIDRTVESEATLESGAKPKPILRMLANRNEECLLICGHQPTLGQLISVAILDEKNMFYLKPAGIACLVFDNPIEPGGAYLEWLMQPAQMLQISKTG